VFVNMYLSVPQYQAAQLDKVIPTMLACGLPCNTYRTESVIFDKASGQYYAEPGMRVTIFDVSASGLIALWLDMRISMGIHCVWIDTPDYSGCICDWQEYHAACERAGTTPLDCSEYPTGGSCAYANGANG